MLYAVLGAVLWLAACTVGMPPSHVSPVIPSHWQKAVTSSMPTDKNAGKNNDKNPDGLPHNGQLTDLSTWWQSYGDPVLVELIDAAQAISPTLAAAKARIEEARATTQTAQAKLSPTLDGLLSVQEDSAQLGIPKGTTSKAVLQPAWEIDIFGGNRAAAIAAQARLEGAEANWHDARVALAAEIATQYTRFRSCEKSITVMQQDADSRAKTDELSQIMAKAGLQPISTTTLARASAAESRNRLLQRQADCERQIKALVFLTALPEELLRQKLATQTAALSQPANLTISSLPAQVIAQRPDVFRTERAVMAASADVGNAEAQRYPRLSLSGMLGVGNFMSAGVSTTAQAWSIGPVSLTLPLFDGGKRKAAVNAAKARYDEAVSAYQGTIRQAVREVEEALLTLHSAGLRKNEADTAAKNYQLSFVETERQYQSGLTSLLALEETRRLDLAAQLALIDLQNEQRAAWIALYRAAGGGWSAEKIKPD